MSVKTFKNIIVKKTSGGGAVDPYKTIENETLEAYTKNIANYTNHKDIVIYDEDITNLAPFAFCNHCFTTDTGTNTDTNTGQTYNIKELNLPNAKVIGFQACATYYNYTNVSKARGANFVKVSLPSVEVLEGASFENISPSSINYNEAYFLVGTNLKVIGDYAFNQSNSPSDSNGWGLYRYTTGQFFTTNSPMHELTYIGNYAFNNSALNKGDAKINGFNFANTSDNLEYIGMKAFSGYGTNTSSGRNGFNLFIPTTGKTLTLTGLGLGAFSGATFYNDPTEWGTPGTLTIKCKETSPLVSSDFTASELFKYSKYIPNIIFDLTNLGASLSCEEMYSGCTDNNSFSSNYTCTTFRVDPSLNTGKEKRVYITSTHTNKMTNYYFDFVVLGDSGYIVMGTSSVGSFGDIKNNTSFARFDKSFRCFNDDEKTTHDNKIVISGAGFNDFKALTHFRNNHFKAIISTADKTYSYAGNYGLFQGCTGLISVKLQGLTKMDAINAYDTNITPANRLNVLFSTFSGDTKLVQVDLGYCRAIGYRAFYNCNAMTKLVIRNEDVIPEVYNSTNIGLPTTCTIYVPSSMIEAYQADSYFSQFTIDSIDNYVDDYESED